MTHRAVLDTAAGLQRPQLNGPSSPHDWAGSVGLILGILVLCGLAVADTKERQQDTERREAAAANKSGPVDQFATPL